MIEHEFKGFAIWQRPEDGYINLNQMAEATGRRVDNWLATKSAKEFISVFEAKNSGVGSLDSRNVPPILTSDARVDRGGGTWAHPKVAIQFAMWCSAEFANLVSDWVFDWMTTGKNPLVHALEHSEPDLAQLTTRELDIQDTEVLYEQQTNHINYYANKMQRARIARERTSRRLRYLHNDQLTLPMPTQELA
jgi:KilA-N domain